MSFILLVYILLSEDDCQALQKEPFRNSCDCSSTLMLLYLGVSVSVTVYFCIFVYLYLCLYSAAVFVSLLEMFWVQGTNKKAWKRVLDEDRGKHERQEDGDDHEGKL